VSLSSEKRIGEPGRSLFVSNINNMKKVGILARNSTENQRDNHTIDSQLASIKEYCKQNNYFIIEEYLDEGYSGELLERPALDKLRDDARMKKFEAVVMLDPDRLSRKHVNAIIVMDELAKNGVEVIFLNAPDTATAEGKLQFDIRSVVAEYEKEKIKERTRRGRLYKAKQGRLVGSIPPYGYNYENTEQVAVYVINAHEAANVRLIFELYTKNLYSMRGICRELYKRKIKTRKSGYKWSLSTVKRILGNTTYIGTTYYNKYAGCEPINPRNTGYKRMKNTSRRLRPKNEWIPITGIPIIIDEQTFQQAQRKCTANSMFSKRNIKNDYLLRGLIYHANCNYKMYGSVTRRKTRNDESNYRCSNGQINFPLPKRCDGTIASHIIDEVVWDSITNLLAHPKIVWSLINHDEKHKKEMLDKVQQEVSHIEKQLQSLNHKEEKLVSGYADGLFDREQIINATNEYAKQKENLEKERNEKSTSLQHPVCNELVRHIGVACHDTEDRDTYISNLDIAFEQHPLSKIFKEHLLPPMRARHKRLGNCRYTFIHLSLLPMSELKKPE